MNEAGLILPEPCTILSEGCLTPGIARPEIGGRPKNIWVIDGEAACASIEITAQPGNDRIHGGKILRPLDL